MLKMIAALAMASCHSAAVPRSPSPRTPPPVTLCRTTEAELRAALGTPTRDGIFHDAHVMSWIVGEDDGVVRYLAVLLDSNHVVVDRVWNIPTEIPWTPTDQCAGGVDSRVGADDTLRGSASGFAASGTQTCQEEIWSPSSTRLSVEHPPTRAPT